jgi:hypothetical protein
MLSMWNPSRPQLDTQYRIQHRARCCDVTKNFNGHWLPKFCNWVFFGGWSTAHTRTHSLHGPVILHGHRYGQHYSALSYITVKSKITENFYYYLYCWLYYILSLLLDMKNCNIKIDFLFSRTIPPDWRVETRKFLDCIQSVSTILSH